MGRWDGMGWDGSMDRSYLCCSLDVLGVAADEGGLLALVGGHCWGFGGGFGRCLRGWCWIFFAVFGLFVRLVRIGGQDVVGRLD